MKDQVIRYSESFKRQVVSDLESGKLKSFAHANRVYGINGACTVSIWVEKYGAERLHPKRIRIETIKERDELKEANKRIRELEAALADAHIDFLLEESFFEIACERMGEDPARFKKKNAITLAELRKQRGPKNG